MKRIYRTPRCKFHIMEDKDIVTASDNDVEFNSEWEDPIFFSNNGGNEQ